MKIAISSRAGERGIILVTVCCIVLVLAIVVAATISLTSQVSNAVGRAQCWNQAIPVLESGLEEGLTQLQFAGTNSQLLRSNSWTLGSDGLYHKTRSFSDGTYYTVSIQVASNPVITSTGNVPVMAWSSSTLTNYLSRRVKIATKSSGFYPVGIEAKSTITLGGSGHIDSFNSGNTNYSVNGAYSAAKSEANAQVLTDASSAGAVVLSGNTRIYGSITTGPNGTISQSGSPAVGDANWDAGNVGVESGHFATNANVQFDDVTAPFTYGSAQTPYSGTYNGTNFTYVLGTGNYDALSINLTHVQNIAVTGNAVLYLTGSFSLAGATYLYIAPGASLKMYVNGTVTIGAGGVLNATSLASNCAIYGLPGCSNVTISGAGAYIGTVYAPEAAFVDSNGGDVVGAVTANTVTISGNAGLHYDEALGSTGGAKFVVLSWNEF